MAALATAFARKVLTAAITNDVKIINLCISGRCVEKRRDYDGTFDSLFFLIDPLSGQ